MVSRHAGKVIEAEPRNDPRDSGMNFVQISSCLTFNVLRRRPSRYRQSGPGVVRSRSLTATTFVFPVAALARTAAGFTS